MMKVNHLFILTLFCLGSSIVCFAQKVTIPLKSGAWNFNDVEHEFTTYKGKEALYIDSGAGPTSKQIAVLNDVDFRNGTIEFDMALAEKSRFSTVYFRLQDADNTEHVYLRSFWANNPNMNSGIQYAAVVDGVNYWDISQEYQSGADFQKEAWTHVRLVVRDQQLLAYVNDLETPALYIPILDGQFDSGAIGFDGMAWIANITITPDEIDDLPPGKGFDPTFNDTRYLRNWQVSAPVKFEQGREPIDTDLPDDATKWTAITAERHGMVNLSRPFGATPRGERRLVWLKTTITSDKAQRRRLDFGYSDEVYTYLNSKPLYQGKNLYNTPSMKAPRGRASVENSAIEMDLQEGENELLIGVTNFFFAWGIVARWDDAAGLRY